MAARPTKIEYLQTQEAERIALDPSSTFEQRKRAAKLIERLKKKAADREERLKLSGRSRGKEEKMIEKVRSSKTRRPEGEEQRVDLFLSFLQQEVSGAETGPE